MDSKLIKEFTNEIIELINDSTYAELTTLSFPQFEVMIEDLLQEYFLSKWISVEEKGLPEKSGPVLITRNYRGKPIHSYFKAEEKLDWTSSSEGVRGFWDEGKLYEDVTHYIILPKREESV